MSWSWTASPSALSGANSSPSTPRRTASSVPPSPPAPQRSPRTNPFAARTRCRTSPWTSISSVEDPLSDLTVDLHIERIPGSDGIPEWAALEFQMNYFRQVLRQNLRHKGKRIVFIHGVGDGILAQAVRKELDEVFALSCSYTFGPMGATNVTIR